jgi:hypothetical protein
MSPKPKIGLFYYLKFSWYVGALLIFLASFFPSFIRQYYSQAFFKYMAAGLRFFSGLLPFALGEWVFVIIVIILLFNTLQYLFQVKTTYKAKEFWITAGKKTTLTLAKLYVVFQLIWGLNYHQDNPAESFNLTVPTVYTAAEMDTLSLELIQELNTERQKMPEKAIINFNKKDIFDAAVREFKQNAQKHPFLQYNYPCLKFSNIPILGDYLGYLAFYQPITGEAIIRGDLPILTLPFTTCHEIAHQLGYASETEANFIAFVIGSESKDPLFKYSMLLQLFSYAQLEHLNILAANGNFKQWEAVVKRNKELLSPAVLQDRLKIKAFFAQRSGLLIPASATLYDQFLLWNKQSKGIESYNQVVLWALAYKKKHPQLTN